MNYTRISTLVALGIIISTVGCKSTKYGVTPLGDRRPTAPSTTPGLSEGPVLASTDGVKTDESGLLPTNPTGSRDGWKEDSELFKTFTVHFEYDSSVLNESEKQKLEAIATQLKANPSTALKIEGHCDERGTEEYNRALGERRALALREELVALGVDPTRLDTISYGDERPVVLSQDEASYRQNRRGEFVALIPPN